MPPSDHFLSRIFLRARKHGEDAAAASAARAHFKLIQKIVNKLADASLRGHSSVLWHYGTASQEQQGRSDLDLFAPSAPDISDGVF